MMHGDRRLSVFVVLGICILMSPAAAEEPVREELSGGWIVLFDGRSFDGWQRVGDAEWRVVDGMITTDGDKPGWLMTEREFADLELSVEFRAPAATNSGVFLRTALDPTDPSKDCYELNIAPPENPFPTGSLVGRRATAKLPSTIWDGRWHSLRVSASAGQFSVSCDGKLVLQYSDSSPIPRGHIGLQAKEGPVAFRNIRLRETGGK